MAESSLDATVTYRYKNLKRGLFIFYSLLYSLEIYFGRIFK